MAAADSGPCDRARTHYEALNLEDALASADHGLAASDRPLACLEVRALVLTVLGRLDEARKSWGELFERAPEYEVADPSLSPSIRANIDTIRAQVRPLSATAGARWLIHESLRIDVLLDGGLRDATRIRYSTTALPVEQSHSGEVQLAGRAATATVAVAPNTDVQRLRIKGQVLDQVGRVLHQFSSELLLPKRPLAKEAEKVIVEVGSDGVSWPVWIGVGIGAVAATVTIVLLAQPNLPDAEGTIGRVDLRP